MLIILQKEGNLVIVMFLHYVNGSNAALCLVTLLCNMLFCLTKIIYRDFHCVYILKSMCKTAPSSPLHGCREKPQSI